MSKQVGSIAVRKKNEKFHYNKKNDLFYKNLWTL